MSLIAKYLSRKENLFAGKIAASTFIIIKLALSTSTNSRAATNYIEILASERQSTPGDIHFFMQ